MELEFFSIFSVTGQSTVIVNDMRGINGGVQDVNNP